MLIKILGPGCRNCANLERATRQAVADLGLEATIEKVTDYGQIAGYGVMRTPGLVVDERVLFSGRVPTAEEIATLLSTSA
jgi:small redox-active disulfide protein 2